MEKVALEDIVFALDYETKKTYSYHSGRIEEDVDTESSIEYLSVYMQHRDTEEDLGSVRFVVAESADYTEMLDASDELGLAYLVAIVCDDKDQYYPDILHMIEAHIRDDLQEYLKYLITGAVLTAVDFMNLINESCFITATDLPIGFGLESPDYPAIKEYMSEILEEIGFIEIPSEETIYGMYCCKPDTIKEHFEEICDEITNLKENEEEKG